MEDGCRPLSRMGYVSRSSCTSAITMCKQRITLPDGNYSFMGSALRREESNYELRKLHELISTKFLMRGGEFLCVKSYAKYATSRLRTISARSEEHTSELQS